MASRGTYLFPRFIPAAFFCIFVHMYSTNAAHAERAAKPLKVTVLQEASDVEDDTAPPVTDGSLTVIKGHTGDLPVELTAETLPDLSSDLKALNRYFKSAAEQDLADIIFFSDFSDANQVVLYVSMPKLGTTLIRNIDAANETLESRFEITAVVIRGILTVMIEGGEIGVHVSEPPPPPSPPTAANPAPIEAEKCLEEDRFTKEARLVLESSVGFGWMSEQTSLLQSFRGALRVPVKNMGIFAGYSGTLPVSKDDDLLFLQLTPHPIELGFWASFQKRNFVIRLGTSFVFDILTVTAIPKTDAVERETRSTDYRVAAAPFISVDWYIAPRAFLCLALVAHINLYQNAFYIKEGDTQFEYLSLWPVMPMVQVGFGLGVF